MLIWQKKIEKRLELLKWLMFTMMLSKTQSCNAKRELIPSIFDNDGTLLYVEPNTKYLSLDNNRGQYGQIVKVLSNFVKMAI